MSRWERLLPTILLPYRTASNLECSTTFQNLAKYRRGILTKYVGAGETLVLVRMRYSPTQIPKCGTIIRICPFY